MSCVRHCFLNKTLRKLNYSNYAILSYYFMFVYRPWVVLGNTIGKLIVYDYQTKHSLITSNSAANIREAINNSQITSIKYSYNGTYRFALIIFYLFKKKNQQYCVPNYLFAMKVIKFILKKEKKYLILKQNNL